MDLSSIGKVGQILSTLDAEGRKRFLALAEKRHVAAGTAIFREGQPGSDFFVLAKGRLRVTVDNLGTEKEVAVLEHGAFFGEGAMMGPHVRSATVIALDESELVAFPGVAVHDLLKTYPAAIEALNRVGLLRAEATMEKLSES